MGGAAILPDFLESSELASLIPLHSGEVNRRQDKNGGSARAHKTVRSASDRVRGLCQPGLRIGSGEDGANYSDKSYCFGAFVVLSGRDSRSQPARRQWSSPRLAIARKAEILIFSLRSLSMKALISMIALCCFVAAAAIPSGVNAQAAQSPAAPAATGAAPAPESAAPATAPSTAKKSSHKSTHHSAKKKTKSQTKSATKKTSS
jgi:hypothetical protein